MVSSWRSSQTLLASWPRQSEWAALWWRDHEVRRNGRETGLPGITVFWPSPWTGHSAPAISRAVSAQTARLDRRIDLHPPALLLPVDESDVIGSVGCSMGAHAVAGTLILRCARCFASSLVGRPETARLRGQSAGTGLVITG